MSCHFFIKLWDFEACSMWWTLALWITIRFEEIVEFLVGVFLTLMCAFYLWSYCFRCSNKIKTMVLIDLGHNEQGVEVVSFSPFYVLKFGFLSFGFYLMLVFWVSNFILFCNIRFLCVASNFYCIHWIFGTYLCYGHLIFVSCIGSLVSSFYEVHWVWKSFWSYH